MFEVLRRYRYVLKHIFYSIIKNVQKLVFHRPVKQSPAPKPTPLVAVLLGKKTQSNVVVEPERHGALFGESIKPQLIYSIDVRTH